MTSSRDRPQLQALRPAPGTDRGRSGVPARAPGGGGHPATVAEMQGQRKAAQPTNKRTRERVQEPGPRADRGRMLEARGLRGHRIGGAQISPKHANFIENGQRGDERRRHRADRRGAPPARGIRRAARARGSAAGIHRDPISPPVRPDPRAELRTADWTTACARAPAPAQRAALLPSRRTLTIAAAVVVAVALAYVAARTTPPLFAVKRVEVRPALPRRGGERRRPLRRHESRRPRRRRSRPASSRCRPSSPPSTTAPSNTLTIFVQAERPVAVVAQGGTRWLNRARTCCGGRTRRGADLPTHELAGTRSPSPGETFDPGRPRAPERPRHADKKFPVRIRLAALAGGHVILTAGRQHRGSARRTGGSRACWRRPPAFCRPSAARNAPLSPIWTSAS